MVGRAEASQERIDPDPERVAEYHGAERGRQAQRPARAAHAAEPEQKQEPGREPRQQRAAREREHGGQSHQRDAEGRQGAPQHALARGRGAKQVGRRRAGHAAQGFQRREIPDAQAGQHEKPRGPVIGICKGPRQPSAGRTLAPVEDPWLAREVVHEREKGQDAAGEQQDAHEAVEVSAAPHEVHDERVHGGVGHEEQERARGLARRHGAQGEDALRQPRRSGRGCRERPVAQRSIADRELKQDEDEQEPQRQVEGGAAPFETTAGGHRESPGKQREENQELSRGQRPARVRAPRDGGPEQRRVEEEGAGGPERLRPAVTPSSRCRRRHGNTAGSPRSNRRGACPRH